MITISYPGTNVAKFPEMFLIQSGREVSDIVVTEDYLCYKEPKSPDNFFSYFNI